MAIRVNIWNRAKVRRFQTDSLAGGGGHNLGEESMLQPCVIKLEKIGPDDRQDSARTALSQGLVDSVRSAAWYSCAFRDFPGRRFLGVEAA